jgi:phage repressor protein C with HTH and peptisase S24 domain
MQPVLHNGYIIAVDQKQTEKSKLDGQIIVVHHRDMGLVVSRYRAINGGGALFPDNRSHPPVSMSRGWRVVGRVMWWIGQQGLELKQAHETS